MIPNSELKRRWTILNEKIEKTGVDVIVATSQENFYYMTGALLFSQKSIPDRLAMAAMDKKGNIFIILCDIEYPIFKIQSPVEDINIYIEFEESPIKVLSELLRKRGFVSNKIGIESRHLVASYYKELVGSVPDTKLTPWDNNFDEIRVIKSPYEIEILKNAAIITEAVIYDTWKSVKSGISERDMGMELEWRLRKNGADGISFLTCCSGIRTTIPHAVSSPSPIEKGDLIKVDFGGVFNGYVSDVARVAFMLEISRERKGEYTRFVSAYKEIIDSMKPGTTASQIFYKAKDIYQKLDIPFEIPHLGHSIGLTGHENPLLQPFDHTELKPGMLFAVEPRAKMRDKDRYHVEDLIMITESGPKVLTDIKSIEDVFIIQ